MPKKNRVREIEQVLEIYLGVLKLLAGEPFRLLTSSFRLRDPSKGDITLVNTKTIIDRVSYFMLVCFVRS